MLLTHAMLENLQGKLNCGKISSQTVALLNSNEVKESSAIQKSPRLSVNSLPPANRNITCGPAYEAGQPDEPSHQI